MSILEFDMSNPHEHAQRGYVLLKSFQPFERLADIVRYHHLPWEGGRGQARGSDPVAVGSHILHLADRASILITPLEPVLAQRARVVEIINRHRDRLFAPAIVDAFNAIADREHTWFDAISPEWILPLPEEGGLKSAELSAGEIDGFARLMYRIIDFRSPYTATHTSGVRACAEALARLCSFSVDNCRRMATAACFHDLGKLSVPVEILEKKTGLTHREQSIIRGHPYYSYRILKRIPSLSDINTWASFHHERIDGTGYPFHIGGNSLSAGSRIMSVADVFTAVTEDRPYRLGRKGRDALGVLDAMGRSGKLDPEFVAVVRQQYDQLDALRWKAQCSARHSYRSCIGQ